MASPAVSALVFCFQLCFFTPLTIYYEWMVALAVKLRKLQADTAVHSRKSMNGKFPTHLNLNLNLAHMPGDTRGYYLLLLPWQLLRFTIH